MAEAGAPLSIGIAGAGLLGRLLAWQLMRAGHQVDVFDPATGPEPVPRDRAPEPYVPTAAGFTAAGMLSPIAELDNAEPALAALGWRSLALWPRIAEALAHDLARLAAERPGAPTVPAPRVQVAGSLLLAHRADLGAAQRMLGRLSAAMQSDAWRAASPAAAAAVQPLDAAALRALEPAVQGPAHAWLLPGEGFIDTVAAMRALVSGAAGARWHWAAPVLDVQAGARGGTLRLADGRLLAFDAVIDVRGAGAKSAPAGTRGAAEKTAPGVQGAAAETAPAERDTGAKTAPDGSSGVRGVRGEIITLDCPGHGLTRPARLLHPRHRVYLVPRSSREMLVGASEIESEDRSPVSLRSAVELLAAAHSVVPALAEARITRMDVNLRPALPDNAPLVRWQGRQLTINGLFRHGWLLAPALVEQALAAAPWLAGEAGAGEPLVAISSIAAGAGLARAGG